MRLLTACGAAVVASLIATLPLSAPNSSVDHAVDQRDRETCRVHPNGSASGPGADICTALSRRWSRLFGTLILPGTIRVREQVSHAGGRSATAWSLTVPLPERTAPPDQYRAHDGLHRYYADNTAPHEAGHYAFMSAHFDASVAAKPGDYSSVLPDWIDESVAIWMESPAARAMRMRAVTGATPSLARLVAAKNVAARTDTWSAEHAQYGRRQRTVEPPCTLCTWRPDSLRPKYAIKDVGMNARGQLDTVVWYADRSPIETGTFEGNYFYELSYALLWFIHHTAGPATVREVIARYERNPKAGLTALEKLPGLPPSSAGLESAWHRFLSSPPPIPD